jgi:hypothetical protein
MFLVKIFSLVFSLMVLFVALLLIFGRYREISNKVDQWISTDPLFERLDSSVFIDRSLLNRLTGILVFIGSSYITIFYLFYWGLTGWPTDALRGFFVIFGLTGILIGANLMMGGKAVREINKKVSTWVSTERLFGPLDKTVRIGDWFYKHNILVGILLLLALILINLRLWCGWRSP